MVKPLKFHRFTISFTLHFTKLYLFFGFYFFWWQKRWRIFDTTRFFFMFIFILFLLLWISSKVLISAEIAVPQRGRLGWWWSCNSLYSTEAAGCSGISLLQYWFIRLQFVFHAMFRLIGSFTCLSSSIIGLVLNTSQKKTCLWSLCYYISLMQLHPPEMLKFNRKMAMDLWCRRAYTVNKQNDAVLV